MAEPATDPAPPLVWRIPPYQPALLMLVLAGAAALNIYRDPSASVRIPTLALGLMCGALAIAALRLQLAADDDGISVRSVFKEQWITWPQVDELEIVPNVRGAATIRINRVDGRYVDVPPSLLQPTKPTSKYVAMRQLDGIVRLLEERRSSR